MKKILFPYFGYEMFTALSLTFIARSISALGGFLLVLTMGHLYGAEGVGVFALTQSIYIGACILSRWGLDNNLMLYVSKDYSVDAIKYYLRWALTIAGSVSLVISCVIYLSRAIIANFFQSFDLALVLTGISIAVPALALSFVLAGFFKGIRKPATGSLLENGSISLVACVFLYFFELILPSDIVNVGWAIAVASWLIFLQGLWQSYRWFRGRKLKPTILHIEFKEFMASSHSFFFLSLAPFIQQVVGVMIAGWLLSSIELGLFRSAERTAFLTTFVLTVINAVLPPRFASLYKNDNIFGLRKLARQGSVIGLIFASPVLFLCLIFPEFVLGFFGPEFLDAKNILRMLSVAHIINVVTGSVGFLLNMTSHEKLMQKIALSCSAIGLFLFLLLIPLLGALGAAIALSISIISQNLVALYYVKVKLGFWVLPIPNFCFKI